MHAFVEVYRYYDDQKKFSDEPSFIEVKTICRVEHFNAEMCQLIRNNETSSMFVAGTAREVIAKIAAAQRPQAPEQEAALFDGPSIKVEGWDGMVALRACDITGIVAVSNSKTKSVIHLRRGSVEALTEPEAVEALIRAARDAWRGKGTV